MLERERVRRYTSSIFSRRIRCGRRSSTGKVCWSNASTWRRETPSI
jgi:hypothetical protein